MHHTGFDLSNRFDLFIYQKAYTSITQFSVKTPQRRGSHSLAQTSPLSPDSPQARPDHRARTALTATTGP